MPSKHVSSQKCMHDIKCMMMTDVFWWHRISVDNKFFFAGVLCKKTAFPVHLDARGPIPMSQSEARHTCPWSDPSRTDLGRRCAVSFESHVHFRFVRFHRVARDAWQWLKSMRHKERLALVPRANGSLCVHSSVCFRKKTRGTFLFLSKLWCVMHGKCAIWCTQPLEGLDQPCILLLPVGNHLVWIRFGPFSKYVKQSREKSFLIGSSKFFPRLEVHATRTTERKAYEWPISTSVLLLHEAKNLEVGPRYFNFDQCCPGVP